MASVGEELLLKLVRRFFAGRFGSLFVECLVRKSVFCKRLSLARNLVARTRARETIVTSGVVSDWSGLVSCEQCLLDHLLLVHWGIFTAQDRQMGHQTF